MTRAFFPAGAFPAVLAILAACSEPSVTAGPPASMSILAGNEQSGTVGAELPTVLVVKVTDSAGANVTGQIVNFVVTAGGGSVFAGAAITNANGEARERWTLGTSTADSQRVEARAVDATTGALLTFAVFRATPIAAAPATLVKVSGDSGLAQFSTALVDSPAVRVRDRFGNVASGVTVAWSVQTGGGTITTTTATNAAGIAKARWTMGATPGLGTARAQIDTITPVTFTAEALPTQLQWAAVSAGGLHTCALTTTGAAYCWGDNSAGQLGSTDSVPDACSHPGSEGRCSRRAIPLPGGFTFSQLASSCGITAAGTRCWGTNVGNGSAGADFPPTLVSGSLTFVAIDVGAGLTCAVTSAGVPYCWGREPDTGINNYSPFTFDSLHFRQLSVSRGGSGDAHRCGLTTDSLAYCIGQNRVGQLGRGTFQACGQYSGTPACGTSAQPVVGGGKFVTIGAGGAHTCALRPNGDVACWGHFENVGSATAPTSCTGNSPCLTTPAVIAGSQGYAQLSVGSSHSCALKSGGAAFCWGANENGRLGNNNTIQVQVTPVAVAGGLTFTAISAGGLHTCGLTTSGAIYCWGEGSRGQLGDGTFFQRNAPVRVINR